MIGRRVVRVAALAAAISGIGTGCDAVSKANDAASQAAKATVDGAGKAAGDAAKQAGDAASKVASDTAKSAGDMANDMAAKAADNALDTAKSALDATKNATARAWAGVGDTGELSTAALTWMAQTAQSTEIRDIVAAGVQAAPVALEIAKTLNAAVDSETAIEPIYQPLDGRDPAAVDKAIGSMPRVEVIDGVNVGFSQLSRTDSGTSLDETAYLVTWRRDTHVVGLVYRTKRTIDFEMLVKEAPRLIALTQGVIAGRDK